MRPAASTTVLSADEVGWPAMALTSGADAGCGLAGAFASAASGRISVWFSALAASAAGAGRSRVVVGASNSAGEVVRRQTEARRESQVAPGAAAARRTASANACALAWRSAGFFCSARSTTSSNRGERPCTSVDGAGGLA